MTGLQQNNRSGQSHLFDYAILLSCLIIILAGIHAARTILSPIFMATFLAVLLLPPLRWLRAKGFSEVTSLTVVILSVLICGMAVATVVGTQLTQFARSLPTLRREFNEKLMNYDLDLGDFIPMLKTETPPEEETPPAGRNLRQNFPQDRNHRAGSSDVSSGGGSATSSIVPVSYVLPDEKERAASSRASGSQSKTDPVSLPNTNQTRTTDGPLTPNESVTQTNSESPDKLPASANSTSARTQSNQRNVNSTDENVSPAGNTTSPGASQLDVPRGFFDPVPLDVRHPSTELKDPNAEPSVEHTDSFVYPNNWVKPSDAMEISSQELFKFVASLTGELSMLASSTFIIMLLVIFMLLEASKLPEKISKALGNRTFMSERVRQLTNDIRRYMLIKTFVSILVGFCVTVLLLATGVQYPFLWGFVAFLLNFIPNIGSVVAAIPPILLALSQQGIVIGCVNIAFFLIINCTIGYLLEPKLLGNGLDLSPLVVLLSLIFCGWLLGAVGMFLSPPLAVIIKIILQSFPETRWIAVLMANKVPKDQELGPELESV